MYCNLGGKTGECLDLKKCVHWFFVYVLIVITKRPSKFWLLHR